MNIEGLGTLFVYSLIVEFRNEGDAWWELIL